MVLEGDLNFGGEHTTQYTDDVSQDCTPDTYINSLTKVNKEPIPYKLKM